MTSNRGEIEARRSAGERTDHHQRRKGDDHAGAFEQQPEQHDRAEDQEQRPPGEGRDRFTRRMNERITEMAPKSARIEPSATGKYPGPIRALDPNG